MPDGLVDIDILEHFGVRKRRGPRGQGELYTAPFVDRDTYLAGMAWKREVHATHHTVLVETYSWERSEGRLLEALEDKLAPHVQLKPRPPAEIYDRVTAMGSVDGFTSLLGTFLRHYKGGDYRIEDCSATAWNLKLGRRAGAFQAIFAGVFESYQKRLGARIDFEDMVGRATSYVETGRYRSPFRHILVDKFQDISAGRAKLIKALKAQHSDARLFAVGDDWQSIYRLTGSDIHVMRHFGDAFGGTFAGATGVHRTVDLGRTFRSVDKIALAAPAGNTTRTRALFVRSENRLPLWKIVRSWTDRPSDEILLLRDFWREYWLGQLKLYPSARATEPISRRDPLVGMSEDPRLRATHSPIRTIDRYCTTDNIRAASEEEVRAAALALAGDNCETFDDNENFFFCWSFFKFFEIDRSEFHNLCTLRGTELPSFWSSREERSPLSADKRTRQAKCREWLRREVLVHPNNSGKKSIIKDEAVRRFKLPKGRFDEIWRQEASGQFRGAGRRKESTRSRSDFQDKPL